MPRKRAHGSVLSPLSQALRFYREAAGLTQPELNELAGVSGVGMIESGARPNAYVGTLDKLAAVLSDKLGYAITAKDLRDGPPQRMPEEAAKALDDLLASPLGADVTPEIRTALRRMVWPPGHTPTVRSWSLVLEGLRSARKGDSA